MLRFVSLLIVVASLAANLTAAEPAAVTAALAKASGNKPQLQKALTDAPPEHRAAVEFLVANMPDRDLQGLTAEFLLADVRVAYESLNAAPWKDKLPQDVFFNNVLPYASINERRDAWRADLRQQFLPLVAEAKTPAAAAAALNQKIFPLLKVKYSTQRPKADQSPYESIRAGTASCTGLAVLLIDACRSVGVPARFVGTPLWTNMSGNHSWVEIWDDGWHFTGAAEPSGSELDKAWFIERAATAQREHPLHAIYAVSFQRTPLHFPLVWDRDIDYVHAVNVTDRYVARGTKLSEGQVRVMFRALDRPGGRRVAAALKVIDKAGQVVFEGTTNDERFDANDHLTAALKRGEEFQVELRQGEQRLKSKFLAGEPAISHGPGRWKAPSDIRFTKAAGVAQNESARAFSDRIPGARGMTTATLESGVQQIGEHAGAVWRVLADHGPQSLAKIVERVGGNRDLVMQGIGWLAREGKLDIAETKRGRIVSLRE